MPLRRRRLEPPRARAQLRAGRTHARSRLIEAGRVAARETDLVTECSCPDWANPCKHVAATHYILGEALDRDPFLLFELRGRTKAEVLELLRAARAGMEDERRLPEGSGHRKRVSPLPVDAVTATLGKLEAADYDRLRGPLPAVRLTFESPVISGGLLRQLGKPAGWRDEASPVELLRPVIQKAAEYARDSAMADDQHAPAQPGRTARR